METSNHWPCVIQIETTIPKSRIFRFENHWLERDDFIPTLLQGWNCHQSILDPTKTLTTKFKNIRKTLKTSNSKTLGLVASINNDKLILNLLDTIESFRDLILLEYNFRERVCSKLISLLK